MSSTRPGRRQVKEAGFVSTLDAVPFSSDEATSEDDVGTSRKRSSRRKQDRSQYVDRHEEDLDEELSLIHISEPTRPY